MHDYSLELIGPLTKAIQMHFCGFYLIPYVVGYRLSLDSGDTNYTQLCVSSSDCSAYSILIVLSPASG